MILHTPTTVKVAGIPAWIHYSQLKKAPAEPTGGESSNQRWKVTKRGPFKIKISKG